MVYLATPAPHAIISISPSNAIGYYTANCAVGTIWYVKAIVSYQVGATLALESEGIQPDKWYDSSTNNLDATYPTTGSSLVRKTLFSEPVAYGTFGTFCSVLYQIGGTSGIGSTHTVRDGDGTGYHHYIFTGGLLTSYTKDGTP
jgi:hypothetical protein